MKRRKVKRWVRWAVALALVAFVVVPAWRRAQAPAGATRAPAGGARDPAAVLVTGYCNCGQCCGWRRSWFGLGGPVYTYGPQKGRPKVVGRTAAGTQAHAGTVAADWKVFPRGTVLDIPGYGRGVVEDVGGAIRGRHIDVWFPTHAAAQRWGARWLNVTVAQPVAQP